VEIKNVVGKYRTRGWYQRDQKDITKLVLHHSAWKRDSSLSDDKVLKTIQGWHEGHGWPGLSYGFVILPNGNIYQCNDFEDVTWHDTVNWDSIGILVHGYFHPPVNDKPTQKQLASLKELLDWLCTKNPQFPASHGDVVAHRDRSATTCPGDLLYPYVTEYREKGGDVNWNTAVDEPDEDSNELREMRKSRTKWRQRAKDAEKLLEEIRKIVN